MQLLRIATLMLVLLSVVSPVHAKTLKIATISPDGLGWMKKLRAGAKEIEEKTDGRVNFKIYPGGVQGDDQTVLRKMRIRQLHGGVMAAGVLTRFYPDLQVYNLPLQFQTKDEVDAVREELDQQIIDGLYDNGFVTFSLIETGFAYLMSKEPISSISDLQKVKAWVPDDDPIGAKLVESFGISPIPLPIPDVLAGLQTGLIDAVAVPPIAALALQWHTQVKYLTNMPLLYVYSVLAIDRKEFEKLSPEDQVIARNVLNRVFSEIDHDNRVDNEKAFKALLAQGIEEVQPSAEELKAWRGTASVSIENMLSEGGMSRESVDAFLTELKSARDAGAGSAEAEE